jgi:adenylate cyclase
MDQEVLVRGYLGLALWMLGYPDQGLRCSWQAVALAQEHEQTPSLGLALSVLGMVHGCRREGPAAYAIGEKMRSLGYEQGLPVWVANGDYACGEALVLQGQDAAGCEAIRQAIAGCTTIGIGLGQSWRAARLAEAQGNMGQVAEGLRILAEEEEKLNTTGERFYEAELWRLKGELTLKQFGVRNSESENGRSPKAKGPRQKSKVNTPRSASRNSQCEAEAEACFLQALEVAHRQQAKSLELRAVMSLTRLWQQRGKGKDAQQMLAEVYGWFSEGFDTQDLREARVLLDTLG